MQWSDELVRKRGGVEKCEAEFRSMDPGIVSLVERIDRLVQVLFGKQALITSMLRDGDKHASGRMIDVDVDEKNKYGGVLPAEAKLVREIVNEALAYDPSRPNYMVAVYGEVDPSGTHYDHIHTQVCWGGRTKARNVGVLKWLKTL